MKLSMSLLGHYLQQYQPEYHITEDSLTIRGVRYLSDPRHTRSVEYVYFDDAGGYFQDARYKNALLLVNGHDQLICRGADREALLNDVLSAFDYYNQQEMTMHDAMMSHTPLKEMLSGMGQVYPGAILLCDLDGNLLAHCNPETLIAPTLKKSILELGRIGSASIMKPVVDEQGRVCHDLTDAPQRLFDPDAPEYSTVSMYVRREEERIGVIMMFCNSVQEARMAKALEPQFARCCAMAEEFYSSDSALRPNHSILCSLLAGEPVLPIVLQKLERRLQLETTASLLAFESLGGRNHTLHSMTVRDLNQASPASLACEMDGKIFILTATEQLRAVLEVLQSNIPFSRYRIGISMPVKKLPALPAARRQAAFAMISAAEPGVYECRALALDYLLRALAEEEMTRELLHPAIQLLREYDADNHADLLETLRRFLENSCSQTDTAKQMNIHLNTLKYRLRRICEIGLVDLQDETELFYLRLSFRLDALC